MYEDAQLYKNRNKQQAHGWPTSTEGVQLNLQPSEEITYSRNPSEIDSLDSNYIHKNYNFDGNHASFKESSPETTDHDIHSYAVPLRNKPLFIRTDNKDIPSDYYLPEYAEGAKSDSLRSSNSSIEGSHAKKSQTNFHVLESDCDDPDSFDETFINKSDRSTNEIDSKTITKVAAKKEKPTGFINSEEELSQSVERITTPPDKDNISVTSYITSSSSPGSPPRRLENLAVSLAEKIDEYCESKYSENFIEIPLNLQSAGNSFNSKSFDDLKSIYTQVNKIKSKNIEQKTKYKNTLERHQKHNQSNVSNSERKQHYEEFKTRSLYRQSSSSKNITTEPFVTTLIENQYFSLPDINISNGLKRSEKIDAKLRQQDDESLKTGQNKRKLSYESERNKSSTYPERREDNSTEINVFGLEENDFCDDSLNLLNEKDSLNEEDNTFIIEQDTYKSLGNVSVNNIEIKSYDNLISSNNCTVVTVDGSIIEVESDKNYTSIIEKNTTLDLRPNNLSENVSVNKLIKLFVNESQELTVKANEKQNEIISDLPDIPDNYKYSESDKNSDLIIEENRKPNTSKDKKRNPVTKHYSLRQREPKPGLQFPDTFAPLSPPIDIISSNEIKAPYLTSNHQQSSSNTRNLSYLSSEIYNGGCSQKQKIQRLNSFKTREINILNCKAKEGTNVTILPLSGHQTIIVEPPITNENTCLTISGAVPPDNLSALEAFLNEPNQELERHEDINFDPTPIKVESRRSESGYPPIDEEKSKLRHIPTVKKERSIKIAAVQNKFERPPTRLIIKDKKILSDKKSEMSRPQVLTIKDNRSGKSDTETNRFLKMKNSLHETENDKEINPAQHHNSINKREYNKISGGNVNKTNIFNVTEKVEKVVKTDMEYQEKLHSVKSYWSKLIENKPGEEHDPEDDNKYENIENVRECLPDDVHNNQVTSVEDIVKSIETVKIVDSIKKAPSESETDVWKKEAGSEKEKAESIIEESSFKRILNDSSNFIEKACDTLQETLTLASANSQTPDALLIKKESEPEYKSFSPDIEIVELGGIKKNNDGDDIKHATLFKSKSYSQDCEDFDHVRYKVMKSDVFRKSMIANYKKEAQFDGLLQYLQDYSFQELLVNNNIVIIEPVRTKIESNGNSTAYKKSNSCRITGATSKQNESKNTEDKENKQRKTKLSGLKRHFFYHPIRVNKEIIEEELPNPDTVKTVRDLFEGTLRMRRPQESSEPCLLSDSTSSMSKKSISHKNLSVDSKLDKSGSRKKVMRFLTIDTSYGQKKWDSASLSSGVSSGDLSSNNDHDYDTDALSPFQSTKVNNDNIYCSSSEEYLCESLNPSLCYESQYVSQDILQKIRECGTSITYYGGKVFNERRGPTVSPMTKAIMDEIRGLQRNCCRDCTLCQSKCTEGKCACLDNASILIDKGEIASVNDADRFSKCCSCSEITEKNDLRERIEHTNGSVNGENYLGFKFKLVKSNSCSSRLELAGTGEDQSIRRFYKSKNNRNYDDPPLIYDNEHSVKTKICRIESYRKGMVASPFSDLENEENHEKCEGHFDNSTGNNTDRHSQTLEKNNNIQKNNMKDPITVVDVTVIEKSKVSRNRNVDLACKNTESNDLTEEISYKTKEKQDNVSIPGSGDSDNVLSDQKSVAETIKSFNDPINYEKKFYYVNSDITKTKDKKSNCKFGEMVFEEFEVLEPNM